MYGKYMSLAAPGGRFHGYENSAQLPCCFGLVISETDVTCKIYSVIASNGLAFTLRFVIPVLVIKGMLSLTR